MTADEQRIASEIVSQWFWQPAEGHNYHYRGALRTLVRFFESAPMEPDVMRLVIEYLRDEEIEGGISLLNKFVDLGAGWKAMDAWYRTDETEKWNGTDSRKVRVYQVLVQRPDSGDAVAGPIQTENGCQYTVTHEFHWNVESLPTPPASSSGVNYTLEGVVRDQETGLYSCVVVRRERVQQDVESYTTAKTIFQDTKEEQHLGVKQGQSAGKSASVSSGTVVERSVTKNPDCTIDVRNVTKTDKAVSNAVVTKNETLFETTTTAEHRNQSGAAKMTLNPGESARDEKTPSNLHNQTVTTVVEKPVSDAVVEFARTLHGTQKSVTHRNQPQPVSQYGMKIGERRSTRKTEGGKNDNTIVTQVVEPAGNVARSERKTVFENSASVRENVAADGELPEREADEAGNGATHSVDVQLNDDGTADIVTNDTTEKPVSDAVVEIRKTARSTVRTVTHRNQPAPQDGDGMAVGETRTSRKTDGGLHDNTTSVEQEDYKGNLDVSTSEDSATRTVSVTKGAQEEPDATPEPPEKNRVVRKSGRYNEHGKWELTTETTIHKPQKGRSVTDSGGVSVTVVETTTNTDAEIGVASAPNVVQSVNSQPNDHDSFTVTRSRTSYREKSSVSIVETETEIAVTTKTINSPTGRDSIRNGRLTIEPNDHGSFTIAKTEITPKTLDTGWITWDAKEYTENKVKYYNCGLRIFKNFKNPPIPAGYARFDLQMTINEYGLFDGCMSYKNLFHWEAREIH
jgi:hypothetical protein